MLYKIYSYLYSSTNLKPIFFYEYPSTDFHLNIFLFVLNPENTTPPRPPPLYRQCLGRHRPSNRRLPQCNLIQGFSCKLGSSMRRLTALYSAATHCTVLHCTAPHCTTLHLIELNRSAVQCSAVQCVNSV